MSPIRLFADVAKYWTDTIADRIIGYALASRLHVLFKMVRLDIPYSAHNELTFYFIIP